MELHLGLDVGTQGTKGLLIEADSARVVARAARSYGLIPGLAPGAAEQHPGDWIAAVAEVARELAAAPGVDPAAIRGVGVSGQQHGLVALDRERRVVRPAKLWCDTETAAEASELSRRLARPIPAGFTASKVLWLARREPEAWRRVATVLLPHDWVNLRLTGEATSEAGDASGTGFFDPRARSWDRAACDAIDPRLHALLPPLIEAGEPAGRLTKEGAKLLALPGSCVGIPVSAGGGDNMMSAIGAGATRDGVAVLSLGTSATIFTRSATPIVDPGGSIAPFCDSTGGWLPLLCVMNATGVLESVRESSGASLDVLTEEAARIEPRCGGLRLLPFLRGERVPDLPDATATLLGIRPGFLERGRLFRAALEGVALNLACGLDHLRALGPRVDSVRLAGGGARNRLWRAILADALAARVVPLVEAESAALGAAVHSLWTARRLRGDRTPIDAHAASFARLDERESVAPDPGRSGLWESARQRFRSDCERLHGVRP
jgi:D-xylulose kinase